MKGGIEMRNDKNDFSFSTICIMIFFTCIFPPLGIFYLWYCEEVDKRIGREKLHDYIFAVVAVLAIVLLPIITFYCIFKFGFQTTLEDVPICIFGTVGEMIYVLVKIILINKKRNDTDSKSNEE